MDHNLTFRYQKPSYLVAHWQQAILEGFVVTLEWRALGHFMPTKMLHERVGVLPFPNPSASLETPKFPQQSDSHLLAYSSREDLRF